MLDLSASVNEQGGEEHGEWGRVFGAELYPARVFEAPGGDGRTGGDEGDGHASFFGAGPLFAPAAAPADDDAIGAAASASSSFFPGPGGGVDDSEENDALLFGALRTRGIGDAVGAVAAEAEAEGAEMGMGESTLPAWRRPQLRDATLKLVLPELAGAAGEGEEEEGEEAAAAASSRGLDPADAVLRSWAWAQRAATGRRRRAAAEAAALAAMGGKGAEGALRRLRGRIAPVKGERPGEAPRAVPPFDAPAPSVWRRVGWEGAWRAAGEEEGGGGGGIIPPVAPLVTQDGPAALEAAARGLLDRGMEEAFPSSGLFGEPCGEPPAVIMEERLLVDHALHALNVRIFVLFIYLWPAARYV